MPNPMHITFLGNSLVEGRYGGSFVEAAAAHLPAYTITNAGVSGSTILNLAARLDSVLDGQPDGVFLVCGGNDAISYSQPDTRRYYEQVQGVPGGIVPPDLFASTYRDVLLRLQMNHVLAWVGLGQAEVNPAVVAAMTHYNALAREAAASLNIPTLDLTAELAPPSVADRPPLSLASINLIGQRMRSGWQDYEAERIRGGYTFTFDGLHLTPTAAQHIGQRVATFLNAQLQVPPSPHEVSVNES
ncbi:MAG: SGNH/GDSL hydrolase family protein [Anaerolineae bacterium]|nr:SGNH/GDSL hydrolase family protein [Anaerolineae bacterium]